QALRGAGVEAEGLRDHAHLSARVRNRLAGVAGLQSREVLGTLLDGVGEAVEQRRAIGRRDRAPGREGTLGPRDRGVGVLGSGARERRHDLLRGGLDDGDLRLIGAHAAPTLALAASTSEAITR